MDRPSTELFIVDCAPAAAAVLGAHRPREDSMYVLCRVTNEQATEFSGRVLRRIRWIRKYRSIGSLWYVVGPKSREAAGSVQLLEEVLPLLENGSRLTLATPRSYGGVVFGWVDTLLGQRAVDVNMGVRFYPDSSELRRGAAPDAQGDRAQCA